jgi:hypothetical protein
MQEIADAIRAGSQGVALITVGGGAADAEAGYELE